MDGKSLLGLLQDPNEGGHDQLAFINAWGPLPATSLSCITRQYKYTYWWYGDDKMKPTEELFDTLNDPLELTNLAVNPGSAKTLASMRTRYALELEKWKRQVVDYNDYQRFGVLFDRSVPISQKSIEKPKKADKKKESKQRRLINGEAVRDGKHHLQQKTKP